MTLFKRGANLPPSMYAHKSGNALAQIALDGQSAHTSRVNLHLKKHVRSAERLVDEIRKSNNNTFKKYFDREVSKHHPKEKAETNYGYFIDVVNNRLSDSLILKIALDVPNVRNELWITQNMLNMVSKN